jgi:Uma2 family endonuclease
MTTVVTAQYPATGRLSQPGEPPGDIALLYPLQGSWTEDDYLTLDTNRLVEFSDGCIEVLPTPSVPHQRIVRFLFLRLHQFVSSHALGEVLFAPLPVRLWPGKFREPDLVYLRPDHPEYRQQPDGADLAIEVVSEGEENRRRDLAVKPQEYARARIPEYWIVDAGQQRITVLILDGGRYREHGVFGPEDVATSTVLPGFAVAVKDVLAAAD